MTGYSVKIVNASKELSARDRVAVKDTTNAIALDDATKDSPLVIAIDYYVELAIHNEKSMMKVVEKVINTDDVKAVHIVHTDVNETLYGMTEQEFIAAARVLPDRKVSGETHE